MKGYVTLTESDIDLFSKAIEVIDNFTPEYVTDYKYRGLILKDKHKVAYMKCCKAFAECSDDTKLHVGTVIVKNNRIISCGYKKTNSCLTHET